VFLGILAAAIIGGVLLAVSTSTAALDAGSLLLVLGGWGVSLCLHEFGHAAVAYKGGDHSVRSKGYLTLDIRRYTDPVLSLVLPLVFLVFGGIPLPGGAVWINHHALRSRRVESLVSLAGPVSNLVIGIVLTLAVRLAYPNINSLDFLFQPSPLAEGLSFLALLQILAFLLNILPVPGLDGFGVIEPWLSRDARRLAAQVRPWAPFLLFALMIAFTPFRNAFFGAANHIFDTVGGNDGLSSAGYDNFEFWRR
jgi:Zn-dependent protease